MRMPERNAACERIIEPLILFYLFERLCAGFMKWGVENGSIDSEFTKHLLERKKKLRDQVPQIEASQKISEFDIGFMPRDLAQYLATKAKKGVEERAFGKAAIDPQPIYQDIQNLIHSRNKIMHGLDAPEKEEKTASRIAAVMDLIAQVLGDELGRFMKLNATANYVNHTSWARLLFLTEEELLWIARGQQLPADSSANSVANLHFGSKEVDRASFRKTERHLRTVKGDSPLYLSEDLTHYKILWVSTSSFKPDRIVDIKARIRNQAHSRLAPAYSPAKIYVSAIPEGLDDVESDSFAIPWWKKAPEGEQYICIALP
jgi:hypothetical protein